MRQQVRPIMVGGFIGIILLLSLIFCFFILTNPTQAGQIDLRSSVNVAATAQAIQAHRSQIELEMAIEAQKANWEAEIARKQQLLAEFNLAAQNKLSPLETQLRDLHSQIEQADRAVEINRGEVNQLQEAIKNDEIGYQAELAALEAEVKLLQDELEIAKAQLQAAYDDLARHQSEINVPPVQVSENPQETDDPQDHQNNNNSAHEPDDHDDDPDNDNKNDDHDNHNDNEESDDEVSDDD